MGGVGKGAWGIRGVGRHVRATALTQVFGGPDPDGVMRAGWPEAEEAALRNRSGALGCELLRLRPAVRAQADAYLTAARSTSVPDLEGLLTRTKFGDYLNLELRISRVWQSPR